MEAHALLLARLQFAFHHQLPHHFSGLQHRGLGVIATLLVLWRRTGEPHFHALARFWTQDLRRGLCHGGRVRHPPSYEFGTSWSRFALVAGNVIGPLVGYEVLTAFFLEATFLGIMLFGWQRVQPWLHVTAAVLVALGTAISGFWILSANSWMHTPAGYELHDGVAWPTDCHHFQPELPLPLEHREPPA